MKKKAIIIAADTFGLYRNKIIEKPKYKMEAFEVLSMLSGKSHIILTGWAVINSKKGREYSGVSETRVVFRKLTKQEVLDYVNDHAVTNWAVSYSPLNTKAVSFIEQIHGSVTSFSHGLPLETIVPILKREGSL